ncbi:hypothetical protein [Nitratifractor sp.]
MSERLPALTEEERAFELLQRKAKAFISGSVLPQRFRNVGDVIILEQMSRDLGIPMLTLAGGLYLVKGQAMLSGQLVIAILNRSGRFDGPVKWEERSEPWGVRAYVELDGERLEGPWIDEDLIQRNGWGSNPHWKNNRDLMARYRAATWMARLYAPDLLFGLRTEGEIIDAETIAPNEPDEAGELDALLLAPRSEPESIETEPKPAPSMARYHGLLIQHGVKPEELERFIEANELTVETMQTLKNDPGGLDAMVENFYEEETK